MTIKNVGVIEYNHFNNYTTLFVRNLTRTDDKYRAIEQFEASLVVELRNKKVLSDFLIHFDWQRGMGEPNATVESRKGAEPNSLLLESLTGIAKDFVAHNWRLLEPERSYQLATTTRQVERINKLRYGMVVWEVEPEGWTTVDFEDLSHRVHVNELGQVSNHKEIIFKLKEKLRIDHIGRYGEEFDDLFEEIVLRLDMRDLEMSC